MRYLRFCRPFSDLKSPPLPCMSCPWTRAIPCTTLFLPFAHSRAFIVARTVVAFHIAYRTNLKSFFQERKSVRMGATFFFCQHHFHETHQLALRTEPTLSLLSFFSLFPLFYYLLSLSPLQSTSTSTCPLCAELFNEKALQLQPSLKPAVGLFAICLAISTQIYFSFPPPPSPFIPRARILRAG